MCEHEFVEAEIMVCKKCYKTMRVLEMEERLAEANADLKAIKNENELLRHKSAGHDTTMLKAELAAAQKELELQVDNAIYFSNREAAERQRAEQAEAQCKRMEGALREIAACKIIFYEENPYVVDKDGVCICESEIIDIAKAALEDKP